MQTVREAISDISDGLKALNVDDKFAFRFLANKLQGKIDTFIKQDAEGRTIFNINEIWKPLPCIKLETATYDTCSEFYEYCDIVKKSKKKIPPVFTGRYGNFIKILSLNSSKEFKVIKSFQYKDIKNREFFNKLDKYCWIEEGYLFIPDSEIEEVRGLGLFKDSLSAEYFNGHCDECYKPLDAEILVPDYILEIAKTAVVAELFQSKRAPVDEKPNLNSLEKTNQ